MKYLTPRVILGRYLAERYNEVPLDSPFYNDDQREYWYKEADKLIEFQKRNVIL